jgi:Phage integrase, N-terminal SAM-like domain
MRCGKGRVQLTECEVPWPEDGAIRNSPQGQERPNERDAHSPLRQRMIDDMNVRKFGEKTQKDYIRHVKTFSTFLGRSPATATAEDLRQFQIHQSKAGIGPATVNGAVTALRFFFRVTLDRPEMSRYLTLVPLPERLRIVQHSYHQGPNRSWEAPPERPAWRSIWRRGCRSIDPCGGR